MNNPFDYLWLSAMTVYPAMQIGRTIHLRFPQGIKPLVLGSGKSGFPPGISAERRLGKN
jgi:hypothetical protein